MCRWFGSGWASARWGNPVAASTRRHHKDPGGTTSTAITARAPVRFAGVFSLGCPSAGRQRRACGAGGYSEALKSWMRGRKGGGAQPHQRHLPGDRPDRGPRRTQTPRCSRQDPLATAMAQGPSPGDTAPAQHSPRTPRTKPRGVSPSRWQPSSAHVRSDAIQALCFLSIAELPSNCIFSLRHPGKKKKNPSPTATEALRVASCIILKFTFAGVGAGAPRGSAPPALGHGGRFALRSPLPAGPACPARSRSRLRCSPRGGRSHIPSAPRAAGPCTELSRGR